MADNIAVRPVHGGNLAWAASLARCAPNELLDFSASICPLGPPDSVFAAIQAELPQMVHYPDPGYGELRLALAHSHGILPEWVMPGNGAAELLTWASRDLAAVGACSYLTPAFSDYGRALRSYGVPLQPIPLVHPEARTWDFASWMTVLAQRDSGGLLLNNPHNPSGHLWHRDELEACLHHCSLVVVDEAFMDFLLPDQQPSLVDWVQRYENLVVLRSLTKFYSIPGLRLGYAIAHPDRLQRWQQWRDPWSVNHLAAAAAIAALNDPAYQSRVWDWLPPTRAALFAQLQSISGLQPMPGAANFLLVRCDHSVTQLQVRLLQCDRIYIRDCLSFSELGDDYFRIAVRTTEENQRLIAALKSALR